MNMMHVRLKAVPVAIAVLMGGLGSSAFAVPVTYGNITLAASYALGGSYVHDGSTPGGVLDGMTGQNTTIYQTGSGADMYMFTTQGNNNAFFHTYGFTGQYTYFGARASGEGDFFASTRATFSQVFTNTSAAAQLFNFSFSVANGELGINGVGAGFAQLMLDVKKNGNSVARNRTTITQTTNGATCDDSSGDLGSLAGYMNCTGNSGASDNGGPYGVSMGLIGAGESFTLDYDIIATVSGNLSNGTRTDVVCSDGYGDNSEYGGYGGNQICGEVVVEVPGSAIARSGDPFESPIFFNGVPVSAPDAGAGLNGRFSDVPEPASLALVGVGLAGLAAMRRKRKLPEQG